MKARPHQRYGVEARRAHPFDRRRHLVEFFQEGDFGAKVEAGQLHCAAFKGVGQRQVGEQVFSLGPGGHVTQQALGRELEVFRCDHDPLGIAGRAGSVDQAPQFIVAAGDGRFQRLVCLDQRIPAMFADVCRDTWVGEGDFYRPLRQRLEETFDIRHRPKKNRLGLAVLDNEVDRAGCLFGVQTDAHKPGDAAGEICHEPVCGIHAADGDAATLGQAQCDQRRRHAARLVGDLAPAVTAPDVVDRLMQVGGVRRLLGALQQPFNRIRKSVHECRPASSDGFVGLSAYLKSGVHA